MNDIKYFIAIIILAIALGVTVKGSYERDKEIKSLKNSITAYNEAEKESIKTITKVREVIKNVKEPCDCYHQSLPEEILKYVRG